MVSNLEMMENPMQHASSPDALTIFSSVQNTRR
jgi:hypothetical protein